MDARFSRLKTYFDPYVETTEGDWKYLNHKLKVIDLPSRTLLKAFGDEETQLRFILSGGAAMLYHQDNKDLCFDLCFEDEFLCDFESFNDGVPSGISIKSFEPIQMIVIDRKDLLESYEASPLAAKLGRIMVERQNLKRQKIQNAFLGKNAAQRYNILLETRPKLLLRTPQNFIASYIGATPERLSRIRKAIE